MKFVKISSPLGKDELLATLANHEAVNENVKFDERYGKPVILVKEKNNRITMTCRMVGGPTKDNGFVVGTFFRGRISEKRGETILKGILTTAPIYHLMMLMLTGVFIYRCISLEGFSVVPVILLVFSYFLFKNEYKKQGIIDRYIKRAFRRAEENKKTR